MFTCRIMVHFNAEQSAGSRFLLRRTTSRPGPLDPTAQGSRRFKDFTEAVTLLRMSFPAPRIESLVV